MAAGCGGVPHEGHGAQGWTHVSPHCHDVGVQAEQRSNAPQESALSEPHCPLWVSTSAAPWAAPGGPETFYLIQMKTTSWDWGDGATHVSWKGGTVPMPCLLMSLRTALEPDWHTLSRVRSRLTIRLSSLSPKSHLGNVLVDMKLIDIKDTLPVGFIPIQETVDTRESLPESFPPLSCFLSSGWFPVSTFLEAQE